MKTKILETTLRDGSYAINFQFTAADTAIIGAALEKAGFELLELGHGVGLRASAAGHGEAVETDEAYLKAAADSLKGHNNLGLAVSHSLLAMDLGAVIIDAFDEFVGGEQR